MAKESKAEKIKRQQKTTEQYGNQRLKIKAERDYASLAMLPRDASVVSPQNRGWISGRPPGQRRRYGRSGFYFGSSPARACCQYSETCCQNEPCSKTV